MSQIKDPDEIANLWNKTKDPKYKELWYKRIKEIAYTHGYYNSKRRTLPTDSTIKTDDGWNSVNKRR